MAALGLVLRGLPGRASQSSLSASVRVLVRLPAAKIQRFISHGGNIKLPTNAAYARTVVCLCVCACVCVCVCVCVQGCLRSHTLANFTCGFLFFSFAFSRPWCFAAPTQTPSIGVSIANKYSAERSSNFFLFSLSLSLIE